jgi:hypothetical protein
LSSATGGTVSATTTAMVLHDGGAPAIVECGATPKS